jgi:hypothetical protein
MLSLGGMENDLAGTCAWCHRREQYELGEGDLCEICLGLCAPFLTDNPRAQRALYAPAAAWVARVFALCQDEPALRPAAGCWWCARDASSHPAHAELSGARPLLCPVCDVLIVDGELPADQRERAFDAYVSLWNVLAAA